MEIILLKHKNAELLPDSSSENDTAWRNRSMAWDQLPYGWNPQTVSPQYPQTPQTPEGQVLSMTSSSGGGWNERPQWNDRLQSNFAVTHAQPRQDERTDWVPKKTIHDLPPTWEGKDPHTQLEPYIKLLRIWMNTTGTLRSQRGVTIMQYASGDWKAIINELDIDDLTAKDSGDRVIKLIEKEYAEYIVDRDQFVLKKPSTTQTIIERKVKA